MRFWNPLRLLSVRAGEGAAVAWPFLCFFCLLAGCVSGPAGDTTTAGKTGDRAPVVHCGTLAFHAVMREEQATLYLPGMAISLPRTPTASGARYAVGGYLLWQKDGRARVRTPERSFDDCRISHDYNAWAEAWLRGVEFRAFGNEPGWILEISKSRGLRLQWNYGERQLEIPVPPPGRQDELFVYASDTGENALRVEVMDRACRDSMKGEVHGYAVRVRVAGQELLGCGRGRMPVR